MSQFPNFMLILKLEFICVTIFLLSYLHISSSCWIVASPFSHSIILIDSAVHFTTMCLLTHVYFSPFGTCASYMLPTCLFIIYLLHAFQAWLVVYKLVCKPSCFFSQSLIDILTASLFWLSQTFQDNTILTVWHSQCCAGLGSEP